MAEREKPAARVQRQAINALGVYTSEDPEGQIKVFKELQKFGVVPASFTSPKELESAFKAELKSGKTKAQAIEALGIMDSGLMRPDGSINSRRLRDSLSPGLRDAIDSRSGSGTADSLAKIERKGWAALGEELRAVGAQLGINQDRGHLTTSAGGAPSSSRAATGESRVLNQNNGRSAENPARPLSQYELDNIGAAKTKADGLMEADLWHNQIAARSGTEHVLNPFVGNLVGSDWNTRYIPPDILEQFNRTFQDLADQGYNEVAMHDHVKAGGSLDARSLARAGSENYETSVFTVEPGNAGPVTVTKPSTATVVDNSGKFPRVRKVPTALPEFSLSSRSGSIVYSNNVARPKPAAKPAAVAKPTIKPQKVAATPGKSASPKLRIAAERRLTSNSDLRNNTGLAARRRLSNSTGDALQIHPGTSLPSVSLFQGV